MMKKLISKIKCIKAFVCMLVFTCQNVDQTNQIKKSLTKLIPSKTIRKSKKPVLYYNKCFPTQALGDVEKSWNYRQHLSNQNWIQPITISNLRDILQDHSYKFYKKLIYSFLN